MVENSSNLRPDLTILIPCYNEEGAVAATVTTLVDAFRDADFSYEILCVNNASTDRTERVLEELALAHFNVRYVNTPKIPGYGVAVRWGLEYYRGQSVVIAMADGSETPQDIANFYQKIREGYDCAFGTRFVGGTKLEGYPPIKLMLNRFGNRLIAWMTGVTYNDFTNGFKCYRREVIDAIKPLYAEHFNLTIEMSISTVQTGARFAIVPNSWKDRSDGSSKFHVFSQVKLYFFTLAYCWSRARVKGKTCPAFQQALNAVSDGQ